MHLSAVGLELLKKSEGFRDRILYGCRRIQDHRLRTPFEAG